MQRDRMERHFASLHVTQQYIPFSNGGKFKNIDVVSMLNNDANSVGRDGKARDVASGKNGFRFQNEGKTKDTTDMFVLIQQRETWRQEKLRDFKRNDMTSTGMACRPGV